MMRARLALFWVCWLPLQVLFVTALVGAAAASAYCWIAERLERTLLEGS